MSLDILYSLPEPQLLQLPGGPKKTKAVNWEFSFNCFCFLGPRGILQGIDLKEIEVMMGPTLLAIFSVLLTFSISTS